MDFQPVERAFDEAVAEGVFPGASLLVGRGDEIAYEQVFGFRSLVPEKTPLTLHTVFDVASLTKPLATTMAILMFVREKKIRLNDQVTRFIPTFGVFGKSLTTFRQLLNHTSGLPGWKPYYEQLSKAKRREKLILSQAMRPKITLWNRSIARNRSARRARKFSIAIWGS